MSRLAGVVRVPLVSGALALLLFSGFFAWSSNFSPLDSSAVSDAETPQEPDVGTRSHPGMPFQTCSGGGYGTPQTCTTVTPTASHAPTTPPPTTPPPTTPPPTTPPPTTPPPSTPPGAPTLPGSTGSPGGVFPSTPAPSSTITPTNPPSTIPASPSVPATTIVTRTATATASAIVRIDRSISLETSAARVKFGSQFTLTGRITSASPACVAGQPVQIQKSTFGTVQSGGFDSLITDSNGVFSATYTGERNANYVARVDATPTCSAAESTTVPVLVKGVVNMTLSKRLVRPGTTVRFTVSVAPCVSPRGSVALLQSGRGSFKNVGSKALSPACTATFARRIRQRSAFQAVWTSQVTDVQSAKSGIKTVRIRR